MQKEILEALIQTKEGYLSGQDLSKRLGVSRTSIWKHIQGLRNQGYKILSYPKLGYRFVSQPDSLLPAEIRWGLSTRIIGREVLYSKETTSTNDLARELANKGCEEGALVIAEHQRAGKGRLGRSWFSPEGGIYLSLVLRPRTNPASVPLLTLLAGVAVAQTIRRKLDLEALLKWPNDVLVNNKKVCGILAEMEAELDIVNFVILGIGVNVNIETGKLPERLNYPATSLMEEKGERVDRKELVQEILSGVETLYLSFKGQDYTPILKEWRALDSTFKKRIKVKTLQGILDGEAQGIDGDGALRLRLSNGKTKKVLSGEVIK